METFEKLMERARELESRKDTDWAEENEAQYSEFDDSINAAWSKGEITDEQFDELALTAFFDYFDLKEGKA